MNYLSRASPLHAARAAAGCAYCAALAAAALIQSNPLVLGSVFAAIALAGVGSRVGRQLLRACRFAVPLGLTVALINALVTRDGLTVIWRLGQLPVLGHTDITLEATAYGGVLGVRAAALVLCAALYTAAVDPDEILRLFRRASFRSALTAAIATRMVPVLARDARRLADAQRCRPGRPPTRMQLMRVATTGMLDRALDVAAALEVRGYGAARRPPRAHRPHSRHDAEFGLSALIVLALAVAGRIAELAPFHAYPTLNSPSGAKVLGLSAALIVSALSPFADRRGIEA